MSITKFVLGWLKFFARLLHIPVACVSLCSLLGCMNAVGGSAVAATADLDLLSTRFVMPGEVVTNLTDVTYIFLPKAHFQDLLELTHD